MEEKKTKYKQSMEVLNQKNQEFITILNDLTKKHQGVIDLSAIGIKRIMEGSVGNELMHYESLNILTPEKAKIIKNFKIK